MSTPTVLGFDCVPYGSSKLATYQIPGTGVRVSLRRETAPLFVAFLREFHRTVEPLDPKSCWGHAPRAIRGSSAPSRHWPGIAVDANATQHPLGASGTFTAGERKALDKLLASFTYQGKRVFRWGGNYSGRKDEMHVELDVPRDVALAAVKVLQAKPPAAPSQPASRKPGSRELRRGSEGPDVAFLQRWIGPAWCGPVDGDFGPRTHAGVERYQRMKGLAVDGIVGRNTWRAMGIKVTY